MNTPDNLTELNEKEIFIFGRLIYLEDISGKGIHRQAKFLCNCGNVVIRRFSTVKYGTTSSCGCLRRQLRIERNLKHGNAARQKNTGAYRSWQAMKQRVKSNRLYKDRNKTCCKN